MGMITIELNGSFEKDGRTLGKKFKATNGGHTMALTEAIKFLVAELPAAIVLDHSLHENGDKPPGSPFGKLP